MQFFTDNSTPEGHAKAIIGLCKDVEKISAQIAKSMKKAGDKKLPELMEKQAVTFNKILELQESLTAMPNVHLSEALKTELKTKLESLDSTLKDSMVTFDVSINVKKTLLEYAKLQIEEQARMAAGYDEKGDYSINEDKMKTTMPPVAQPRNI